MENIKILDKDNKEDINFLINKNIELKKELNSMIDNKFSKFRGKIKDINEIKNNFLKKINNKNVDVFIIKKSNEIIGFMISEIKYEDPEIYEGYYYGKISNFWINDKYRKNGYSSLLKEKAEKTLKEKGCKYITLEVLENNYAKDIYKKWGYEDYMSKMKKII